MIANVIIHTPITRVSVIASGVVSETPGTARAVSVKNRRPMRADMIMGGTMTIRFSQSLGGDGVAISCGFGSDGSVSVFINLPAASTLIAVVLRVLTEVQGRLR